MSRPLIPLVQLEAAPQPALRLRFMEIVRRRLVERRYSTRTAQAYQMWIRRFVVFSGRRHPEDLGEAEVAAFLSDLAVRGGVSASRRIRRWRRCCFCTSEWCAGRSSGSRVSSRRGRRGMCQWC